MAGGDGPVGDIGGLGVTPAVVVEIGEAVKSLYEFHDELDTASA